MKDTCKISGKVIWINQIKIKDKSKISAKVILIDKDKSITEI